MGANSSVNQNRFRENALYDMCTKTVTKFTQETNQQINNSAKNEIINKKGATLRCKGDLTMAATVTTFFKTMVSKTSSMIDDIVSQLEKYDTKTTNNKTDQTNKDLNLLQFNSSVNVNSTDRKITAKVRTELENSLKQSLTITTKTNAQNKILNEGLIDVDGKCTLSASSTQTATTDAVYSSVRDTLIKNKVISETIDKVDNTTTQKNEGLDIGMMIFGIIILIILVIGCLVWFGPKAWSYFQKKGGVEGLRKALPSRPPFAKLPGLRSNRVINVEPRVERFRVEWE